MSPIGTAGAPQIYPLYRISLRSSHNIESRLYYVGDIIIYFKAIKVENNIYNSKANINS